MYMWMSPQSVDQGNCMEDEEGISSIKTRFAYRFVRALKQLRLRNNRSPTSYRTSSSSSSSSCWSWSNSSPTPTPREIYGRYRMVKLAADASMAYAVGPRRAWSRAMILKIRCHDIKAKRIRKRRCGCGFVAKRGLKRRSRSRSSGSGGGLSLCRSRRAEEPIIRLRKVVPGGGGGGEGNIGMNSNNKEMDVSSLLDETAHYIQCLSAQVLVMSNILNHFSFSFRSPPPPPPTPPPTHCD